MPWSSLDALSWALVLRLLALLRPPGLGEACTCAPAHPQQHVCHSALVIRAKISSEKVVPASEDPTDTQKMIRYEIKQIKMFKGFEKAKDVQYVYTPFDSSLCGVKLETNSQKQYLLTAPNECLWTDWLLERKLYGYQAQHYVCMKHVDGICSWYRGHLHLRKEYVDIIQP
ncbi:Metalloproteinase inhibitor 4 [Cricetulus griseus]|uniref:Metalloproteinase inhibitor 4 n=1 Tax=Cricetulus griseus TaxID=10029 RepID=G3HVG4_CRIGR|nr:Metalloproteinase inhibitor 4 [Cricetulus griseus]